MRATCCCYKHRGPADWISERAEEYECSPDFYGQPTRRIASGAAGYIAVRVDVRAELHGAEGACQRLLAPDGGLYLELRAQRRHEREALLRVPARRPRVQRFDSV